MSKEFEPYDKKVSKDFKLWDMVKAEVKPSTTVAVDEEKERLEALERLKAEAKDKGYKEGLQQAKDEINDLKGQLHQWLELIQRPVQLIDKELIDELVETICWVSKACIGIELSTHPEKIKVILDTLKDELPAMTKDRSLAMHPEDIEWIQKELKSEHYAGVKELLVADEDLSRGDFYLRSHHSELDGRLSQRLSVVFDKHMKLGQAPSPDKDTVEE